MHKLDHQHTYSSYRDFLLRTLRGIRRVLKQDGVAVLVIGDVADPGKAPLPLAKEIWQDIGDNTGLRQIDLIEDHIPAKTKLAASGATRKGKQQTAIAHLCWPARTDVPSAGPEIIDWDEPYKDGGPDAAHARLREMRFAS